MQTQSKLRRLLALVVAVAVCMSLVPWTIFAADGTTATLVTDASTLAAGDQIIIVATDYNVALSTNQKSNNRGQTDITRDGDTVTLSEETQIITLEAGLTDGTWALNVGDGYLYAASSSSNHLKTETTLSANSSWSIEIADGVATLLAQGDKTRNWLRYNSGSSLFACYAATSSQYDVSIYKVDTGSEDTGDTGDSDTLLTVADGTYVLWQADSGKALSALDESYSYGYAPATDVTMTDGTLSGYGNADIFTVTNTADGKFTLTDCYDRLVYMSGTYNSFNVSVSADSGHEWYLADAGEGAYYIYNAEMEKYIQYTSYGSFGAYNYENGQGTLTLVAVTPVEDTPEETTPEETTPEETGSVTWTQVEFSDISAEDTIAITMSKDGTTWVLPNVGEGSKGQPLASYTGTVEGTTLTTDVSSLYSWTITAADGGYSIMAGESYLYLTADNNGMRVGSTAAVWNVVDGYLASADSKGDTRYLGVYNSTDWRCYKNTTGNTAGQTLAFWKLNTAEEETASFADGTYVVWYAPEGKAMTALSESYNYGYMSGVNVALTDGTLTGYGSTEAFTFASTGNGTYTITDSYGRYIYMSGTYNSFNVSATLPESGGEWTVTAAEDGTYTITNAAMDKTIAWSTGYTSYGAYSSLSETSYLTLTPWVETEQTPDEEEPATGIADGDYVIWVPAYNMALSSEKTGNYNAGVSVKLEGENLSGYGETEIWTVTNNEDGTITISQNGSKLSMAESYSSLTMDGVNDTWTLTALGGDLYNVRNVGRSNYLEWYNAYSNWSTYNSSYAATDDQFQIMFTPAEAAEESATGIADGDYVIWAPAYNVTVANSFNSSNYQLGTSVTPVGDALVGYSAIDVWTVTNNDDGTISIAQDGLYLGGSSGSLTLVQELSKFTGEDYAKWNVIFLDNGDCYLQNVGNSKYLEWYASYSDWTLYSFYESSAAMYTLRFTPAEMVYTVDTDVVEDIAQWSGAYTEEAAASVDAWGDKYVAGDKLDSAAILTVVANGKQISPYYLPGSNGYMGGTGIGAQDGDYIQLSVNTAGWGDMTLAFRMRSTKTAPGAFRLTYSTDGGTTWKNFSTGSYAYAYTQYTSDGSYPVSASGSITDGVAKTALAPTYYVSFAFDVPSGAENCENLLIRLVPGDILANGNTGNAGTTSTIRMDSVVLSGSPIVADSITSYVTVTPNGVEEDQPVGTELTMTSETGATIYYRVNGGEWLTYDENNKPTLETLPCDIEVCASIEGKADSVTLLYHYAAGTVSSVKMSPNGGGVYIEEGSSATITLSCATDGATIYYATSADGEVYTDYAEYTEALVLNDGFEKLYVRAYAVKAGYNDSAVANRTFTERESAEYSLYFGQLHSHTNISDGAGSVTEAYKYAYGVDNLDFLAVTDHSNSFDNSDSGSLSADGTAISTEWAEAKATAAAITDETFVGLYGFEMTWSNGLGHMNTFNTPGWQSRTQSDYTTYATALQNYYESLTTVSGSISQFNHPGTTFGDFSDFAHYTEEYDELITLIEVGNGEGAIGSSGYFPSYEYYTRALDKGWHVAPTNNQDNHKGLWGSSNTGRTVVMADSLTEESIYDALRNYRVYATEDNDLSIFYSLDGCLMGSILDASDVGDTLTLTVSLSDPTDSAIGKVEVIVNGGLSIASQTVTASSETVTFSVAADYSYYYIKVTEADGDIAVTAPVWVGEVESVGISSFTVDSQLNIAGEEQNFTMELYNNENSALEISSIVYTDKATGEVIYTETGIDRVAKFDTASSTFAYTFAEDGIYTITATVTGTLNGLEKTYTQDLELTVMPKNITSNVIVDGTHYNDYVTGYYGGNMSNMTTLAAQQGINVTVETEAITAEMLADCALLVISAPARFSGTANAGAYEAKPFEDEFIQLVADYVANGGNVIVCGLADYQDKKAASDDLHAAAQLNKLLEAIGSTMRINDDEVYDEENNGGQAYRLYPESFNMDSQWCKGIVTADSVAEGESYQTYSQYSGCTVDAGEGTWLVAGFDTTYSIDSDNDGLGGIDKGEAVFLAVEETAAGGHIFAAGGVFVSDFEVKAELDNIWDLPYANRTIYENILGITRTEAEVTPIAQVRASAEEGLGSIFVIEGYVTAGTANENTTFFDAIYVQDETGGITVFPYSESGLALGTKLRITGYTDAYQGDIEIQIISCEILDEVNVIEPEQVSNADAMNYDKNGGQLLKVQGVVTEVIYSSDGKGVSQFVIVDENGDEAKIFIDGYILSGTTGQNTLADIVKVGNTVSAVGLLYLHPEGDSEESVAVLRVRDCDEVILIAAAEAPEEPTEEPSEEPSEDPSESTESTDPTESTGSGSGSGGSTSDNASTGDSSAILAAMALMMSALAALAVLLANRKRLHF